MEGLSSTQPDNSPRAREAGCFDLLKLVFAGLLVAFLLRLGSSGPAIGPIGRYAVALPLGAIAFVLPKFLWFVAMNSAAMRRVSRPYSSRLMITLVSIDLLLSAVLCFGLYELGERIISR